MTSKEVSKWSDSFMFKAETSDASVPPKSYLLGAPVDPLGQIAACAKMYKGEVVRDLAHVTDAERMEYLEQIQKTVLKMPLEAVSLHFMVEGVHRGITHQMVRQRTAAFAQESTRFAVKEDLATATSLPPSLKGTLSRKELVSAGAQELHGAGIDPNNMTDENVMEWAPTFKKPEQQKRLKWDEAVKVVGETYMDLVNEGMPAEEARGLMPTNITTRLNYITNLRSFYDTMAVRVSDQAQFEWREVAMSYAQAMRVYGNNNEYKLRLTRVEFQKMPRDQYLEVIDYEAMGEFVIVAKSSAWQYEALMKEIKPIEFKIGGPAFGANFDRPSRIGERVRAFHSKGVPSDRWTTGAPEFNIPAINPEEWLLDPHSARLDANQEFDIFGQRRTKGTGAHWKDGHIVAADGTVIQ
jgi:flavin-dependent thymidylate synthase